MITSQQISDLCDGLSVVVAFISPSPMIVTHAAIISIQAHHEWGQTGLSWGCDYPHEAHDTPKYSIKVWPSLGHTTFLEPSQRTPATLDSLYNLILPTVNLMLCGSCLLASKIPRIQEANQPYIGDVLSQLIWCMMYSYIIIQCTMYLKYM